MSSLCSRARHVLATAAFGGTLLVGLTLPAPASSAASAGVLHFSTSVRFHAGAALASIACGSASSCVVLDSRGSAAHFNGTNWGALSSLGAGPHGAGNTSVSCASRSFCVASPVGSNTVVTWRDGRWSTPQSLAGAVGLESVGCAPGGYCAAVDGVGNSFQLTAGGWQRTDGDWGAATSISCVDASFCISAGPNGLSQWNGGGWTLPSEHGATSAFTGVSCTSISFCVAVDRLGQALHFDGKGWSKPVEIDPGRPSATSLGPAPSGVSCADAARCVVVDNAGSAFEWYGHRWSRALRDPSLSFSGVSCPTVSLCMLSATDGNVLVGRP